MYYDVALILAILLVAEPFVLRSNYRAWSPTTMFLVSIASLFVFPYWSVLSGIVADSPIELLSAEQLSLAMWRVRTLVYTYALCFPYFAFRIARAPARSLACEDLSLVQHYTMPVLLVGLCVKFLSIGAEAGFSPATMLDRVIHPGGYIELRIAPLLYLDRSVQVLAFVFSSVSFFSNPKKLRNWLLLIVGALLILTAARKSGAIYALLLFIVVEQKLHFRKPFLRPVIVNVTSFACAMFLLVVAFVFFLRSDQRVAYHEAAKTIATYQQEAYFLPHVIEHFPWSHERPITLLVDTLYNPIPRAIWESKPYGGAWARYYGPTIAPGSMANGTVCTFGCLSEAHLLFGVLGAPLYGLLWAFLSWSVYRLLLSGTTISGLAISAYFVVFTYFLCRTGFLDATFWEAVIPLFFAVATCGLLRRMHLGPIRNRQALLP